MAARSLQTARTPRSPRARQRLWGRVMKARLKAGLKLAAAPFLYYGRPPSALQPHRLEYWLDTILMCRYVPGVVLEVGCHMAGTAVRAAAMMAERNIDNRYLAIDTFSGF